MAVSADSVGAADRDERAESSDAALVERLANGEREAVVTLYRAHHEHVRRFARRLVGDVGIAEDLVHEVFVALPASMERFRGECSLQSWLVAIAARHASRYVRAAQRRRAAEARLAHEPKAEVQAPDAELHRADLARILTEALDALPLDQRIAFVLCEVEERTSVEVGEILGENDGTIRARVFHAKKKLRETIRRRAMSDRLDELTGALRDDATTPENDGAFTLARIERSLGKKQRTRRKIVRVVLMPIAAVFLVGTAWAGASGTLSRWLAPPNTVETERTVRDVPPPPPPSVIPVVPVIAAATTEPLPSVAPVAIAIAAPDPDALYKQAHTLHFVQHDYAGAVTAWDRYLAAAGPSGRFALEARYNRAIALTRLGRKSEAAAALRPFANGDYGGYRREQAQELLRTLE